MATLPVYRCFIKSTNTVAAGWLQVMLDADSDSNWRHTVEDVTGRYQYSVNARHRPPPYSSESIVDVEFAEWDSQQDCWNWKPNGPGMHRYALQVGFVTLTDGTCEVALHVFRADLPWVQALATELPERIAQRFLVVGAQSSPSTLPDLPDTLSAREKRMVSWMLEGKTDAEIAGEECLSTKRVSNIFYDLRIEHGEELVPKRRRRLPESRE